MTGNQDIHLWWTLEATELLHSLFYHKAQPAKSWDCASHQPPRAGPKDGINKYNGKTLSGAPLPHSQRCNRKYVCSPISTHTQDPVPPSHDCIINFPVSGIEVWQDRAAFINVSMCIPATSGFGGLLGWEDTFVLGGCKRKLESDDHIWVMSGSSFPQVHMAHY